MQLQSFEVNRNWQVKAESALAAAVRCAIEDGGNDLYSYSVLDMSTGRVSRIRLGSINDIEVTIRRGIKLPGGKFAQIAPGDTPLAGTECRWMVYPSIPGETAMTSMAEVFVDEARAMRHARKIGMIIGARGRPVVR